MKLNWQFVFLALLFTVNVVHGGLANKKVIIVGAGASGIAAAARLVEKGLPQSQLTIFEAENRIGGRIYTAKQGSGVIEIGAQWVHGTNNDVYRLAAPAGELRTDIQTSESTGYADNVVVAYTKNAARVPSWKLDLFRDVMDEISDSLAQDLSYESNISLGTYMNQEFNNRLQMGSFSGINETTARDLFDWERLSSGIETSTPDWFDVSGPGIANYPDYEGDEDIVWKRGYFTLFSLLLQNVTNYSGKALPLSDRIFLNTEVTSIRWDTGDKAQVIANGTTYEADVVLVTVSLGVLKAQADKMFQPLLPSYTRKAIAGLGFGVVAKIFLQFQKPWWNRTEWKGVSFMMGSKSRTANWTDNVLGFYTMMDQPNLLIGWISGDAARVTETTADSDLLRECSRLLKSAIGSKMLLNYTEPIGVIHSSWYNNPHFRGTYSYRSMLSDSMDVWASDLAEPLEDSEGVIRVLFAGEATHSQMYSTVHAAVESGRREANRLALLP